MQTLWARSWATQPSPKAITPLIVGILVIPMPYSEVGHVSEFMLPSGGHDPHHVPILLCEIPTRDNMSSYNISLGTNLGIIIFWPFEPFLVGMISTKHGILE